MRPIKSKPNLFFSKEEQAPAEQPIKTRKANPTPKNENSTTQQRTVQADNGKKTVRLHFKESEQKKSSKLNHIAREALAAEIHKRVEGSADENVAVEATHRTEQTVEAGYRLAGEHTHAPKAQSVRSAARAETLEPTTNPLSRWRQRQAIKRQYAATKSGAQTATNGSYVAANAVLSTADKVKQTVQVFAKNNEGVLIVGIVGMMLIMLVNGASSCAEFGVGGLNAVLGTSYVSEDRDLQQVEAHYAALEADLERNIDRIESDYPGYDEYHYEIDEIGHNPYAAYDPALICNTPS